MRGASLEAAAELASRLVMESMKRSISEGIPGHMGVDFEGVMPWYVAELEKTLG